MGVGVISVVMILVISWIGQNRVLAYKITEDNGLVDNIYYNVKIGRHQKDVRDLAINITRGCNNSEGCYFWMIYHYLEEFDYVYPEEGTVYSPLETIRTKSGDCKNMVVTFCSMMRSVGQDCYWSINREESHIVALTYVHDKLKVVDLASDFTMEVDEPNEYWEKYF